MSQGKIVFFLVTVLVLAIFVIAFLAHNLKQVSTQEGLTRRALNKSNKELQFTRDSAKLMGALQADTTKMWKDSANHHRELRLEERSARIKAEQRHEKSKIAPVPKWSSPELDSIINALVEIRKKRLNPPGR